MMALSGMDIERCRLIECERFSGANPLIDRRWAIDGMSLVPRKVPPSACGLG
jgi:hypothetical protein